MVTNKLMIMLMLSCTNNSPANNNSSHHGFSISDNLSTCVTDLSLCLWLLTGPDAHWTWKILCVDVCMCDHSYHTQYISLVSVLIPVRECQRFFILLNAMHTFMHKTKMSCKFRIAYYHTTLYSSDYISYAEYDNWFMHFILGWPTVTFQKCATM